MAVGWVTALKIIPWAEVIKHAPVVADGARKLWSTVARDSTRQALSGAQDDVESASGAGATHGETQARIARLEASVEHLQGQMLASSELIRQLADQNEWLVARVEANRVQLGRLTAACVVLGIVAVVALVAALGGR